VTFGWATLEYLLKEYTRRDDDEALRKKQEELIDLLEKKTGISRIFPTREDRVAIHQPYQEEISRALLDSNNFRLLSIAGYEAIGKGGARSLFYDYLRQNPGIDVRVILLSPASEGALTDRVRQLQIRDSEYTLEKLRYEISETQAKVLDLKAIRGQDRTKLYFCRFPPIFRLIILDDCLFMNTYEEGLHGHASPMYRIDRVIDRREGKLSLYDSFFKYFENIEKNSDLQT